CPDRRGSLTEVDAEVVRRTRAVGTYDHRDLRAGQLRLGVVGLDRRVVPRGDLTGEDLGDRVTRQLEVGHARKVVRERDRVGDRREVEDRSALDLALVGSRIRRIAAREVGDLVGELLAPDPRTLAGGGVVDRHALLDLLEVADDDLVVTELQRRTRAV